MKRKLLIVSFALFCLFLWSFVATNKPATHKNTSNSEFYSSDPFSDTSLKRICNCQKEPYNPIMRPIMPVDVSIFSNTTCGDCQPCFNSFAWQWFITLNWIADPANPGMPDNKISAKNFGNPGDMRMVTWESWKNAYDVFRDTKPDPWGSVSKTPGNKRIIDGIDEANRGHFGTHQSDNTWLIDQNGNMVFYELRVNKDEFNYIFQNTLYSQEGIYKAFKDGPGINMPSGPGHYGDVGAIEVKASWMIVPDGQISQYSKKYKLAVAMVPDIKNNGRLVRKTLAMIGFHIAKKTPLSPQWVWATFEHIDNAPDSNDFKNGTLKNKYNLYNPALGNPGPVPNYITPAARLNDPTKKYDKVQVIRANVIRDKSVIVNNGVRELIRSANPASVFQYYELVDVQWPTAPTELTRDLMNNWLPTGCPAPRFEANTTMETYTQIRGSGGATSKSTDDCKVDDKDVGKSSCIGCHSKSATTPNWTFKGPTTNEYWWTDYSSLFFKAKSIKQ